MGKKEFLEYAANRGRIKWKTLGDIGFPNYAISNFGDVKNIKTGIIKKSKNGYGVELYSHGVREYYTIAKLKKMYFMWGYMLSVDEIISKAAIRAKVIIDKKAIENQDKKRAKEKYIKRMKNKEIAKRGKRWKLVII